MSASMVEVNNRGPGGVAGTGNGVPAVESGCIDLVEGNGGVSGGAQRELAG